MKEEVFENPVKARTYVPAPHFDDPRVVLTAQSVVPLAVIRLKLRIRRMLFLGGALAIALLLGAASALVAVQMKRLSPVAVLQPSEISQITEPEATTAAAAALPVEIEPAPESQAPDSTIFEEAPVAQPVRPAPKRPESLASRPRIVNSHRDSRSVEPSEEEELEQIREAVLYEQWQERRARRAARRERRNRTDDRDLSHLDEIFEGRQRRSERPY